MDEKEPFMNYNFTFSLCGVELPDDSPLYRSNHFCFLLNTFFCVTLSSLQGTAGSENQPHLSGEQRRCTTQAAAAAGAAAAGGHPAAGTSAGGAADPAAATAGVPQAEGGGAENSADREGQEAE